MDHRGVQTVLEQKRQNTVVDTARFWDKATTTALLIPFFMRNGSIPDISKIQAVQGKPGVGNPSGSPINEISLLENRRNHLELLGNEDLMGMLTVKRWSQIDSQLNYTELSNRIEELLQSLKKVIEG